MTFPQAETRNVCEPAHPATDWLDLTAPLAQAGSQANVVSSALIRYPRFKELHEEIRLCQHLSKRASEPQCMSLEGRTGTGKSTLVRTYANSFPIAETDQGRRIPVFYLEVPSPVGIKDLATAALKRIGDPACEKGTRAALTLRLIGLLQDCDVELVILDDFHHLIDKKTNHILSEVSDWLKYLIKETGVPFLVVGIDGHVEVILEANPQLSRLFAARETLQPFVWDTTHPETLQDLAHFVAYTEQVVGRPLSKEIARLDWLYRIHAATDGVVGNLMNLMRVAAALAEARGRDALDLGLLSIAYEKRLCKHMKGQVNPFSRLDTGPPVLSNTPTRSTLTKLAVPGSRKRRALPAGDVLKAT